MNDFLKKAGMKTNKIDKNVVNKNLASENLVNKNSINEDLMNQSLTENSNQDPAPAIKPAIEIEEELLRKILESNRALKEVNLELLKKFQNTAHKSQILKKEIQAIAAEKDNVISKEIYQHKEAEQMSVRIEGLSEILKRNMNYISELKTEITELKAHSDSLRRQAAEIRKTAKINEFEMLSKEAEQKTEEIKKLKMQLRQKDSELSELSKSFNEAEELKQKNESTRTAILIKLQENHELKEELKKRAITEHKSNEKIKQLNETMQAKDEEISTLKSKEKQLTQQCELLDKANKEILEKFMPLQKENEELNKLLSKQQQETDRKMTMFTDLLKVKEAEANDSLRDLAREFLKRELSLKVEIDHLKKTIETQNELIAKIKSREEEIILELNKKFKELFINQIELLKKTKEEMAQSSLIMQNAKKAEALVQDYSQTRLSQEEETQIRELVPAVSIAIKHGKTPAEIRKILINSGYDRRIVDMVIIQENS